MQVAREMHRAFAPQRVPIGGIGKAEILGFQSNSGHRLLDGHPDDFRGGLAGRPTGGLPFDLDAGDPAVPNLHGKLGRTEHLAIAAQAALPGKAASRGRGIDPVQPHLFSRRHHRDLQALAHPRQIV